MNNVKRTGHRVQITEREQKQKVEEEKTLNKSSLFNSPKGGANPPAIPQNQAGLQDKGESSLLKPQRFSGVRSVRNLPTTEVFKGKFRQLGQVLNTGRELKIDSLSNRNLSNANSLQDISLSRIKLDPLGTAPAIKLNNLLNLIQSNGWTSVEEVVNLPDIRNLGPSQLAEIVRAMKLESPKQLGELFKIANGGSVNIYRLVEFFKGMEISTPDKIGELVRAAGLEFSRLPNLVHHIVLNSIQDVVKLINGAGFVLGPEEFPGIIGKIAKNSKLNQPSDLYQLFQTYELSQMTDLGHLVRGAGLNVSDLHQLAEFIRFVENDVQWSLSDFITAANADSKELLNCLLGGYSQKVQESVMKCYNEGGRSLDLSHHLLSQIPDRMILSFFAENLEKLNLAGNLISKIDGLQDCTKLRKLDLSHNNISEIGGALKNLVGLERVSLAGDSNIAKISPDKLHPILGILDELFSRTVKLIRIGGESKELSIWKRDLIAIYEQGISIDDEYMRPGDTKKKIAEKIEYYTNKGYLRPDDNEETRTEKMHAKHIVGYQNIYQLIENGSRLEDYCIALYKVNLLDRPEALKLLNQRICAGSVDPKIVGLSAQECEALQIVAMNHT